LGRAVVGASKPEDKDVGPEVASDEEMFETGPASAGPKFGTNAGGGAAVTVVMVAGASVGVETDGVEIATLGTAEVTVDVAEVIEGMVLVGEERVLRV
jgi:hypothetical protein